MNNYNNNLQRAFHKIGESKSLDFLATNIILEINKLQLRKARIQTVVSRTFGALSFIALFPAVINIFNQLQTSGFSNYFSLIFTDAGIMAIYWKQFLLSLAESLPLFGLTIFIFILLIMFISFKFALKDFKRVGLSTNLA